MAPPRRPRARTAQATDAATLHGRPLGPVSREGKSLAFTLLDAPARIRLGILRDLPTRDRVVVLREGKRELGTPYAFWHDSPVEFVEDVGGETVWGKQREFMNAVPRYTRTIVPAGFGVGKTFGAGRLVCWAASVNAPGTMVVVTTATRFRQVRYQLWPHIRAFATKAGLPGRVDTTQWKMPDVNGKDRDVAYGFTAPDNDEAAMQGIHGTPKLLLVVDEAGGISPLIGKGTNNLLTGDARMLAIGNPPMNNPGSWFEEMSVEGEDPDYPTTTTIRIRATDSPAIKGEPTPICRACVPNVDGHTIAGGNPPHLPDKEWLERTMRAYGDPEHPYIVAKIRAEFPKDSGNKAIPASWVDLSVRSADPEGEEYVRLCDLGMETETDEFTVKRGSWVRLGVDVAADGGDEFVIARVIGDVAHIRHYSSGKSNVDANVVTRRIIREIREAERLAAAIGSHQPVRVKIDVIGLGWGVTGSVRAAAQERGEHGAEVVGVNVAEAPLVDDPAALMRPVNKRAEMWFATRSLLQPDPATDLGRLRLRIDTRTAAQLSTPNLADARNGCTGIEPKAVMRRRGVKSPDRAEAILLGVYEPEGSNPTGRFLLV